MFLVPPQERVHLLFSLTGACISTVVIYRTGQDYLKCEVVLHSCFKTLYYYNLLIYLYTSVYTFNLVVTDVENVYQ